MKQIALLCLFFLLVACKSYPPLETVKEVELEKYLGQWYEIARYPNRFQSGCNCSAAHYSLNPKGYIDVVNTCSKSGNLSEAKGKAYPVENANNTKLRVQFQWPFRGDYWIILLADDYRYSVVSGPSRKYLWILCRSKTMTEQDYSHILAQLKNKGFDTQKLVKNEIECFSTKK